MTNNHPAVEVTHLVKRYGSTAAVDDLSFDVLVGEVFGLLGPNGAGKTTTVECIEGLRHPDSGNIRVLGLDVRRDLPALKERIGIQLQTTGLYPQLTVCEVIDLFAAFFRHPLPTGRLIALVGLEEKEKTRTKDLSGGQKQRLSLALALVNDPDILFLDEPTTGLDPQARRSIWELIEGLRARGKSLLLTTHYMDEAERLCERVAVIDHGKIIAMSPPQTLIRENFREQAVEFSANPLPVLSLLEHLPGVHQVRMTDHMATCYSADVPATMAGLITLSQQGELAFEDLTVRRATLEDVFLKLTGRKIRE